jgi:hypothetical protein
MGGHTPMGMAAMGGHLPVMLQLAQAGARWTDGDPSPLQLYADRTQQQPGRPSMV